MKRVSGLALLMLSATALANDPPPPDLYDTGGAVCLRLAESGKVDGAFIGRTTGNAEKDKRFLAWARQMRWPSKKADGEQRGEWFELSLMSEVPSQPVEKVDCQAMAALQSG